MKSDVANSADPVRDFTTPSSRNFVGKPWMPSLPSSENAVRMALGICGILLPEPSHIVGQKYVYCVLHVYLHICAKNGN